MLKRNINLTIIISLIIVILLSATYAYVELSASTTTGTSEAGCFVVDYTGGPSLEDLTFQSTASHVEVQSTYVTVSKNSGCQIYKEAKINLHTDLTITNAAPLCYEVDSPDYTEEACSMKYRVMQGENLISEGSVMSQTEQELATVELTNDPTTYTIYIWIDSATSGGLYNGKEYSGYIYASSVQSSTIDN